MNLLLKRNKSSEHATIGSLFIDGEFEAFTLEDVVREVPDKPVSEWKILGRTAIPQGTYNVIISYSQRFGKLLPLLVNVPGFTGVRIHTGNTSADTEGCILVGSQMAGEAVVESRKAMAQLMEKLTDAFESFQSVHIRIENGT
jgi:hypothetical protein